MNSKKHRILTSLCLLTMLALLVGCTNNSSSTPETICGTYTSGEAEFQKILAVDQNNQVYYADKKMTALYSVRCDSKREIRI